ncbi:MAG: UbiA family prenyltransferase, partial [Pyrinomonadaceae bacterium]
MKSITAEEATERLALTRVDVAVSLDLSLRERFSLYLQLTKPRITFMIVLVAAAAFRLADEGALHLTGLIHSLIGITLLSSGIATLNQYMERDLDLLMKRTASRPLPSGKLPAVNALVFGVVLTIFGEIYLT